jgi:hypothetical protein
VAFDPSVISQIPDGAGNPVAAVEQGYKLADMQNVQESNKLQLGQQKQQIEDHEKAKNILKSVGSIDSQEDATKAAEKLTKAGLPDEAMQFMKTIQGLQAGKGDLDLQQYQIQAKKADIIGSATGALFNEYDQKIRSGVSPTLATALMQPKYQQAIEQLKNSKLPNGSPALGPNDMKLIEQNPTFNPDFVHSMAEKSQQGAAALQAQIKHHDDERKDETEKLKGQAAVISAKAEDRKERGEEEKEKHDRAEEEAKKAGIPDKMPQATLDTAVGIVMADPNRLKDYTTGSRFDPRKQQIQDAITDKLKESNMTWQDLERLRSNFRSENKSIDKMVQQRDAIQSFETEARSNGERVLQLLDMVDDTHIPMVEGFTRSVKRKAGNIDASELASTINSFQTQTARIIAGSPNLTGVISDSARKDLQSVAPQNMNSETGRRIINRLFTEMDVRAEGLNQQIKKAQDTSVSPGGPPASVPRDPAGTPLARPGQQPQQQPQPQIAGGQQPAQQPQPQQAAPQPAATQPSPPAPGVDPNIRALWQ